MSNYRRRLSLDIIIGNGLKKVSEVYLISEAASGNARASLS